MDTSNDGIAVCVPVSCALLLLGWVGLCYYLRWRLSRHARLGRTPLQDQAHQARRMALDLAGKAQAWPACLRHQDANSEYAVRMDATWREVDDRMARLPGSLAQQPVAARAVAAAGRDAGVPAATVRGQAGQ
jgi:hypothetical protein